MGQSAPTPWRHDPGSFAILDAKDRPVAFDSHTQRLIARSVNNHRQLLDALTDIGCIASAEHEARSGVYTDDEPVQAALVEIMRRAYKATKAAKGEGQ